MRPKRRLIAEPKAGREEPEGPIAATEVFQKSGSGLDQELTESVMFEGLLGTSSRANRSIDDMELYALMCSGTDGGDPEERAPRPDSVTGPEGETPSVVEIGTPECPGPNAGTPTDEDGPSEIYHGGLQVVKYNPFDPTCDSQHTPLNLSIGF